MDKLIQEELERMKLLSRYNNSKTLSEQKLYEYTYQNGNPAQPAGASAKQVKGLTPAPAQVAKKPAPVPTPLQLKDAKGVQTFQDWLDTNAKGWASGYRDGIINKGKNGGGYGKFGPRTQKAWSQYKDQYLKMEPITPKGVKELPVQTQGSERVEPKPVTSQKPPTQDQEITLQGNPKSAFG